MGILAVLLAAAAGFGAGAIWYGVLGRRWMAAVGRSEAEVKGARSATPFVVAIVAALLTAGMLRHVFAAGGIAGAGAGLVAGIGVGVFVVAPWIVTNYAFAARPRALWWIDAGHAVFACAAIGLVLGLMA
jgi:hypothetical protein